MDFPAIVKNALKMLLLEKTNRDADLLTKAETALRAIMGDDAYDALGIRPESMDNSGCYPFVFRCTLEGYTHIWLAPYPKGLTVHRDDGETPFKVFTNKYELIVAIEKEKK